MSEQLNPPEKRRYEVSITLKLPGNVKETTYPLTVEAYTIDGAYREADLEWRKATEPHNVQIREVPTQKPVITA